MAHILFDEKRKQELRGALEKIASHWSALQYRMDRTEELMLHAGEKARSAMDEAFEPIRQNYGALVSRAIEVIDKGLKNTLQSEDIEDLKILYKNRVGYFKMHEAQRDFIFPEIRSLTDEQLADKRFQKVGDRVVDNDFKNAEAGEDNVLDLNYISNYIAGFAWDIDDIFRAYEEQVYASKQRAK